MVRRTSVGIGSVLLVSVTPAKAAVTGTPALRGYVSSQALVRSLQGHSPLLR